MDFEFRNTIYMRYFYLKHLSRALPWENDSKSILNDAYSSYMFDTSFGYAEHILCYKENKSWLNENLWYTDRKVAVKPRVLL